MTRAAQVIRDSVGMDDVLRLYGYETRRGFMICPFHGDRDASLKVYRGSRGWHCYGCGRGGSVIDFVMAHEGCDFRSAVRALDAACGLRLLSPTEDPFAEEMAFRLQSGLDRYVAAVYRLLDFLLWETDARLRARFRKYCSLEDLRVLDPARLSAGDVLFLLTWEEEALYDEYRKEKLEEARKEVAAWRRKVRAVSPCSPGESRPAI